MGEEETRQQQYGSVKRVKGDEIDQLDSQQRLVTVNELQSGESIIETTPRVSDLIRRQQISQKDTSSSLDISVFKRAAANKKKLPFTKLENKPIMTNLQRLLYTKVTGKKVHKSMNLESDRGVREAPVHNSLNHGGYEVDSMTPAWLKEFSSSNKKSKQRHQSSENVLDIMTRLEKLDEKRANVSSDDNNPDEVKLDLSLKLVNMKEGEMMRKLQSGRPRGAAIDQIPGIRPLETTEDDSDFCEDTLQSIF